MISSCKDYQFTLFTTFKPFAGESACLQDAALASWSAQKLPVIVFGDDAGVAPRAARYGFRHEADVRTSGKGAPFISDMIKRAAEIAETPYVALINGDILLDQQAVAVIDRTLRQLAAQSEGNQYLLSARRRNIPLTEQDVTEGHILETVAGLDARYGHWDIDNAIDIFIFDRTLYRDVPDLSVGRSGWDNWLLWEAKRQGAALVDLSAEMALKHPIHGYVGPQGGWANLMTDPDVVRNQALVAGDRLTFSDMDLYVQDSAVQSNISESKQDIWTHCRPDPQRELMAGLRYLEHSSASDDEKLDACRSLLWRLGAYFPFACPAAKGAMATDSLLAARTAAEAGDHAAAVVQLQAILCGPLIDAVGHTAAGGGTVYIWGAGDLGARAYRYLRASHPDVRFCLISKDGQAGGDFGEPLPVYRPAAVDCGSEDLILVASIYVQDILSDARACGFGCRILY